MLTLRAGTSHESDAAGVFLVFAPVYYIGNTTLDGIVTAPEEFALLPTEADRDSSIGPLQSVSALGNGTTTPEPTTTALRPGDQYTLCLGMTPYRCVG